LLIEEKNASLEKGFILALLRFSENHELLHLGGCKAQEEKERTFPEKNLVKGFNV